MNFALWLEAQEIAGAIPKEISLQQAVDRKLRGPLYHGTSEENRGKIGQEGFKLFVGGAGEGDIRNGYAGSLPYHGDVPAPIHHLGYGIYFTYSKNIAKQFNSNTGKGLKEYYIDAPRFGTINFGAPRTMMKWWIENGYDPELAKKDRIAATVKLTDHLKMQYDAIWFKGRGIRSLLDGDQVCIFDPSRIYVLNNKLAQSGQIGSKVYRKVNGITIKDYANAGTILNIRQNIEDYRSNWDAHYPGTPHPWLKPETKTLYDVKWNKGGIQHQAQDGDIELA